jgi:hypothetical protein
MGREALLADLALARKRLSEVKHAQPWQLIAKMLEKPQLRAECATGRTYRTKRSINSACISRRVSAMMCT